MIRLTADLYYSKGTHKECYLYPGDPHKCIKIPYNDWGVKDLNREIRYLHLLDRQHKDYSVLPRYYGTVETDHGTGHVFELITDYDGSKCRTLEDILHDAAFLEKYRVLVIGLLLDLNHNLYDNEIVTMGLFPINILFQRTAPDQCRIRIINDMGSKTLFSPEYHLHWYAKNHVKKRWQGLIRYIKKKYKTPLPQEIAQAISNV